MRTIHKLLTGLLLLSGVSFAAHAQNPTWGESITKDSFISRAGQAQQAEGSTSTTGFNKGDFFIVLLDTSFFPEYYGAYADGTAHTSTGINTNRLTTVYNNKATLFPDDNSANRSQFLFNRSVSQVYKLKPLNVTINHTVKHRRKAHYTNDTYEKNPGKLYAYNGTLSRFIFVERNKQYAFTGGSDSPYNPYKRKNNNTDHLTPSGDAGFCEYGIDPQDLSTSQTSQKRAITSDWEAAFGSTEIKPLEAYLSENNLNAWNEYGVFAFTHDCSGGTWRSHFMHTNIPKVETDIPNSGQATDAQCNAFTASITPTQNNTILVFVPQKPTAPSSPSSNNSEWIKNQADSGTDYGIVPKHAPYIQFYLGKFFPKNEATDVVLHENDNYVTHKFAWFTNVYDKYNRDENASSETYKQGIEEFKVYARVEGTETWQLIETSKVRPFTNAHEKEQRSFIGEPDGEFLLRKSFTYNMEYKVESTIVDLGVSTTIQTLLLPVPALTGSKSLNLTVFSSSRAVDNVNRASGDSGDSFGTNYITHKLTIIPTGINEVEGDTYTVTRKWDTAKDAYGNEQTIKITINASGQPEITEGMPAGAEWTVTKEAGNIILTLTEIRTADYENDYRNCDKYMVSYTGATQDVASSPERIADYYTVDKYKAEAVLYTESGGKYHYFDRVTFTQVNYGQWRYLLRQGDIKNGTQWTQETYHDAASTDPNPVEINPERQTTTPPPATLFHTGYLVFSDADGRGTWGVGTRKTAHDNTSTVVCDIIPHNQVVEVAMQAGGANRENPIWNYPTTDGSQKAFTKQIFPGVDFDITASKFYTYKVAFGLVLYTKNSNGQWERTIADGQQYFNKISAAGEENDNGIVIPKFDKTDLFDVPEGGKTITQNVVFDFQGTDCKYDAFAFYVIGGTGTDAGEVVAYAHSGSALIKAHGGKYLTEEEARAEGKEGTTNLYYGSQLYVNGLSSVVGEDVNFANSNGVSVEDAIKYKTIDGSTGPVRDKCYYQGNPENTYDGFAYVVLDLDKVIPTTDVNFEKEGARSEDLLPAITSYKITAYQPGNEIPVSEPATTLEGDEAESEEEAESGDEETEPVKEGLHVFYPTIGYYPKEGAASYFDITNYDTNPAKQEIVGTAPGLNWNVTPTDEMQVYADITLNASTATSKYDVNIVEGVHPTPVPETTTTSSSITNRLESAGNNCVLIGLRYIDKTTVGDLRNAEGSSSAPRREGFYKKDNTDLANDITLFIEPEYTIVSPEKPVYSFGGSYQRTTKPTYVSDVMTKEEGQQSGGQGAPAKAGTQAKNQIPVIGNPNAAATYLDYLTRKIIDIRTDLKGTINREQPVYMPSGGQILGVDDVKVDENVKVFADGRDIVVEGAEGEVIVFNAYGQSVYAGHSSRIAMAQPGVYLVAANGSIYKVFVK